MTIAGRYQLQQRLGSGAMGEVYLAVDITHNQQVAVKRLKLVASEHTKVALERFRREGQALRGIEHPNIVNVLDMVEENGEHYLIMDYVAGGTLAQRLQEDLDYDTAIRIALELSDALARAHHLNIIHRDVKPSNVLLSLDGTPRLTDFGVAYIPNLEPVTETGMFVGTIAYASPETCLGQPPTKQTDLWSFGTMLYEMLTGVHPYERSTAVAMLHAIVNEPPPDPLMLNSDLPTAVVDLLYRLLDKNPAMRLPSARRLGAQLEAQLNQSSPILLTIPMQKVEKPPRQFPHSATPFIGRRDAVEDILQLLKQHRLVTLLGPGGIGKTRLSIEVGQQSKARHDVVFVSLAPLAAASEITEAIIKTLGLQFAAEADSRNALLTWLARKDMLVILDNFEHVIQGSNLVADILNAAPNVHILVTSRRRLNLGVEQIYEITGLQLPTSEAAEVFDEVEAVKVFSSYARRGRPGFQLPPEDRPAVAHICHMLDGNPLALELAAGWSRLLSPVQIAEEIARDLDFLEAERVDLPKRQRSMRAMFTYSWSLLEESERQTLSRMSIFRGGATLEAMQAVTNSSLRTLLTLVNHSLIQRDATTGRFTIHEVIRQFAAEQLDEASKMQVAHADYYLGMLAKLTDDIKGGAQLAAIERIETDFNNVEQAWLWAVEQGNALAIVEAFESLFIFINARARNQQGRTLFGAAASRWPSDSVALPAALMLIAYFPSTMEPEKQYWIALDIAQRHENQSVLSLAQNNLGRYLAHYTNKREEGIRRLHECATASRESNDDYRLATCLDDLAFAYYVQHDFAQQLVTLREVISIRRRIGDFIGLTNSLVNMIAFHLATGRLQSANEISTELAYHAHQMRQPSNIGWALVLEGNALGRTGQVEEGINRLEQAISLSVEVMDQGLERIARLAKALYEAIDPEKADVSLQTAEMIKPTMRGDAFRILSILPYIIAYTTQEKYADALVAAQQLWSETPFIERGHYAVTYSLGPLALISYHVHDDPQLAADLLAALDSILLENGETIPPWGPLQAVRYSLEGVQPQQEFFDTDLVFSMIHTVITRPSHRIYVSLQRNGTEGEKNKGEGITSPS